MAFPLIKETSFLSNQFLLKKVKKDVRKYNESKVWKNSIRHCKSFASSKKFSFSPLIPLHGLRESQLACCVALGEESAKHIVLSSLTCPYEFERKGFTVLLFPFFRFNSFESPSPFLVAYVWQQRGKVGKL